MYLFGHRGGLSDTTFWLVLLSLVTNSTSGIHFLKVLVANPLSSFLGKMDVFHQFYSNNDTSRTQNDTSRTQDLGHLCLFSFQPISQVRASALKPKLEEKKR